LKELIENLQEKYPNVKVNLYKIRNDFFGEKITVAGLITGQDLMAQLKGKELGSKLLLPCNMLRDGEEVFLDDITLSDVKESLQVKVDVVKSSGQDLIEAILA
jgi:NifB/MoaA-like Fe-S oxidoreductase